MAAKHSLRYLQGTVDFGMDYRQGDGVRLEGYTDSDWAGCASDRKSTSGVVLGWVRQLCRESARNNSELH